MASFTLNWKVMTRLTSIRSGISVYLNNLINLNYFTAPETLWQYSEKSLAVNCDCARGQSTKCVDTKFICAGEWGSCDCSWQIETVLEPKLHSFNLKHILTKNCALKSFPFEKIPPRFHPITHAMSIENKKVQLRIKMFLLPRDDLESYSNWKVNGNEKISKSRTKLNLRRVATSFWFMLKRVYALNCSWKVTAS